MILGRTASIPVAWAMLLAATAATATAPHYEPPPCQRDETDFEMAEIDAAFCTRRCKRDSDCPSDRPDGVMNKPRCALGNPDDHGERYCAILCKPLAAFECGFEMHCLLVPDTTDGTSIGICAYPNNDETRAGAAASPTILAVSSLIEAVSVAGEEIPGWDGEPSPSNLRHRSDFVID